MSYLSSHHFAEMEVKLLPLGERVLYCCSIGVHPTHQGRGVGTALVRWACDKADADGVGPRKRGCAPDALAGWFRGRRNADAGLG
jgi:GNAT superfamily N-acetyltransferase